MQSGLPKFTMNFGFRAIAEKGTAAEGETQIQEKQEPVLYGDKVMVVFKGGYIRHQEGSIFHGNDNHVNLIVSFKIQTGNGQEFTPSLATTRIPTGEFPIQDVVILPPTQIQDYFSLTVNVIETSELKVAAQKISSVMPSISNIVSKIPAGGNIPATSVGIIGDVVNMVITLSPDQSIISSQCSYLVDEKTYPNASMSYLYLGKIDVCENGAKLKNGEYYVGKEKATRMTLELFRPVSKS